MDIETRVADGIQTIAFNRPAKKNAITAAMYRQLADAFRDAQDDASVRVILVVGLPAIFTAGNDLEDFLQSPPSGDDSPVFRFLHGIRTAEKPVVAAVRGAAIGIGTTLLLHCDLVYAGRGARFALPFVQLGICPEAASSLLLPRMVGHHRAAEKLLLGEPFGADEALRDGLREPGARRRRGRRACRGAGREARGAAGVVGPHDEVADERRRARRRRGADEEGRPGVPRDAVVARGARGVLGVPREAQAGLPAVRVTARAATIDQRTLDAYAAHAAGYADDWLSQPPPLDLQDAARRWFRRGGATADIGCGSGRDVDWLNREGFPCVGYDASDALLAEARRRFPARTFAFAELPALDGIADRAFDNVLCETVLMHLPHDAVVPAVRGLRRILKPHGALYLSWRVATGEQRDDRGRLYSALDADAVVGALDRMTIRHSAEATSASSGKRIHAIVATDDAAADGAA